MRAWPRPDGCAISPCQATEAPWSTIFRPGHRRFEVEGARMDQGHIAVRLLGATDAAHRPATRVQRGDAWVTRTFGDLASDARGLAAHLIDHGVRPGDRVALFSANRPEWTVADLAIPDDTRRRRPDHLPGTPDQVRHILADSGAVLLLAEGHIEVGRVASVWDDLPEAARHRDARAGRRRGLGRPGPLRGRARRTARSSRCGPSSRSPVAEGPRPWTPGWPRRPRRDRVADLPPAPPAIRGAVC